MSKYVIIDYRAEKETINNLRNYFDKIVLTKPAHVHKSIDGHADITICKISNNEIVVSPSNYNYYKTELPDIKILSGGSEPYLDYPNDIIYNAACRNDTAIHNFEFSDKITLAVMKQKFSKHINVGQGYSKCSICFVNNDGIITDDEGIYKILIKNDFDVLKISKGDIKLKGMNYGFFGGATGLLNENLFLNGEIKKHSDSEKILNYLEKHNTNLIELKKGDVTDIGSIICLES